MIDVNTLIGPYPFRRAASDPDVLVRVLDREVAGAWAAIFHRRSIATQRSNRELYASLRQSVFDLCPPFARTGRNGKRASRCRGRGAPAIRAYPPQWGLGPRRSMKELLCRQESGERPHAHRAFRISVNVIRLIQQAT